jgi:GT2 family glycosyltransferase/glycosyltransferase involved in cell wall biosynthesis
MDTPPLSDVEVALFDPVFYLETYADVRASGMDALRHYEELGRFEGREPNGFFSAGWYLSRYPDVREEGFPPLQHYARFGARELRDPHPRFDARFYVLQTPEAADNPLLYHLAKGRGLDLPTERSFRLADCLPSALASPSAPAELAVDVIVPVYRGLAQTRRCLRSLLRDPSRRDRGAAPRLIVIDDASPEPALSRYLDRLAARGLIHLLRHPRNLGYVASVNWGIAEAGRRDVVLLNSDTEVPAGWLSRLAGQAYADPDIASVSPLSNNATICSYPAPEGGPLAFGESGVRIDAACQAVNAGRWVRVPTTVGFCMYLRREALDELGAFDEAAFGRGYGEEGDFCMRAAAAGWHHRLACDVFVYHEGGASFGADAPERAAGMRRLADRWPDYERRVALHLRRDEAAPFRLATTLRHFATNGLPTILTLRHALEGGIGQHVRMLATLCQGEANILVLRATMDGFGVTLGMPGITGHPEFLIPLIAGRDLLEDVLAILRPQGIARIHVHHWMDLGLDLRRLIRVLDVPFDLTLHDWYAICPRINLLPVADGAYCGEPGPALCDRCIQARDDTKAQDITAWRAENAWLPRLADRVLCATQDGIDRFGRHGFAGRAVLAPLEDVAAPLITPERRAASPVRVAVLGVLARHKGARHVTAVAELAPHGTLAITLIGRAEHPLPDNTRHCLTETGEYAPDDLPALIAGADPDVIWFPATWPETWSYTLTAAILSGRPIVASDIGAFRDRLRLYARARLVPADAPPDLWVEALVATGRAPAPLASSFEPVVGFYPKAYLAPLKTPAPLRGRLRDLRVPGKIAVILVPERLENALLSPCAFIRMLLPLTHPAAGRDIEVTLASAEEALSLRADVIMTHRYAVPSEAAAGALLGHAAQTQMPLLFDLDDNLMDLPPDHADADRLRPKTAIVAALLRGADAVHVSTVQMAASLARWMAAGRHPRIVENGLDERLWSAPPPAIMPGPDNGTVRIVYMGTETHGADLALVLPVLARLHAAFGARVAIDIVGIVGERDLPPFLTRVAVPHRAGLSYPAFVAWLVERQRRLPWAIGIAPLVDTPFNRCKSPIKMFDYAALGLATVASDMPAYRGMVDCLADGEAQWFHALDRLVCHPGLRHDMAQAARAALSRRHTLSAQAPLRLAAIAELRRPAAQPMPS